jgi:peroxiredoxin
MHCQPSRPDCAPIPKQKRRRTGLLTVAFLCLAAGIAGALGVESLLHARLHEGSDGRLDTPRHSAAEWFAATLPVGSAAPDFTLPRLEDGRQVRLSSFRGHKPVVLVFGSLSCDRLCDQWDELERLRRAYQGRAEFLFVYIREAHMDAPRDRSRPPMEWVQQTVAERKLAFPCIFAGGGEVERAYDAWPKRLVVVGVDGRIALDAGRGLPDRWELDEVEAWLESHTHA